MKFSAFTVKTVSRMVTGTPTSGPRDSVPMSATGTNRKASCTPSSTITPAAAIWPVSLVSASRPNRSSRTPSRQISPPATRTAIVWVLNSKLRFSEGSSEATSTPAATPRYMATPPPRGVGMMCTSRSRTAAITRNRTAATRTTGVARKVTTAAARRTTAYSRIGSAGGLGRVQGGGFRIGRVGSDQLADTGGDLGGPRAVGVPDRRADQRGDRLHVRLDHALRGDRRAAHPDARGYRRRLRVERDGVLVQHDAGGVAAGLGDLAGDRVAGRVGDLSQVQQRQVGVGAAGDRSKPLRGQSLGERLRVGDDLAGVGPVLRLQALLQVHRLRGDGVHERAALHHREGRLVDRLGVLGLADDGAAAGPAQHLVRGEGDDVGVRNG